MRAPLAMALTGALLAAGCGGDDAPKAGDAEQTVRRFVEAVNQRDGRTICTELVTDAYLHQSTNARGAAATRACERQIRALAQGDSALRLGTVFRSTVDGDRAVVVANLRAGKQTRRTTFRLRRQGDAFRLESGAGA